MKKLLSFFLWLGACNAAMAQQTRQQLLRTIIEDVNLPGVQVAYTGKGQTSEYNAGTSKQGLSRKIKSSTIFRAGSLGKCVFAYAVLRLYDRGVLSLDTPLMRYIGSYDRFDPTDPRYSMITARMVLSHTSDLAEFSEFDTHAPVKLLFAPGSAYSYSGEGYWFLQKVVEKLVHKLFEQLMQEEVFNPLGMHSSTYVQTDDMDTEMLGKPGKDLLWMMPNAAFTLLSNAHDYNLFLQALLAGKGLKPGTQQLMFSRQTKHKAPGDTTSGQYINWGLGVGLAQGKTGQLIWHWGKTDDFFSFFVARPDTKESMVFFTRGESGSKITDQLIETFLGKQTAFTIRQLHFGYDHPETMPQLYSALRKQGFGDVPGIFNRMKSKGYEFSERDINSYGKVLLQQKRYTDAREIFKQQAVLYPQSSNAYASFAEAREAAGDHKLALKSYQRSVKLDSTNEAAMYHIQSLQNPDFTADRLKAFTGKFSQAGKPELFLQLTAKENRLILTQSWDGGTLIFFRIATLEFYNAETTFKLRFEKDEQGNIKKAFVAGNVAWVKE
ncbi:serine hydrolase [Mucilaginibacter segetis]|uniref:Class A beta-lactamase-related serine hydrolase n=1 Tax=Mucilaginibacter segetis TaxID=2793071 RepID=A0A934ULD8_9SPHI|nr:serine hydrolase [Mucilaginibacter segetis]MBK0377752.1 class A beta-lactamase-related serine hydrolase [Mucilaginibacter segetis]